MKIVVSLILFACVSVVLSRTTNENGKRLIKFSAEGKGEWLTQEEIDIIASKRLKFMDVTDQLTPRIRKQPPQLFDLPTKIRYRESVESAISHLDVGRTGEFMNTFTSFHNRYYTTPSGVAAANWLFDVLWTFVDSSGYEGTVEVIKYFHTEWEQPSVIVRIEGTNSTASPGLVILGAHLDSVTSGPDGEAPGADDNGSGCTVLLEAFRSLIDSRFVPKSTVEFHWYAAEEVGLRGAMEISTEYFNQGKEVIGMANFDMAGYVTKEDPRICLIRDFTDDTLNVFMELLIEEYNDVGWMDRVCGYGCSDHAAWTSFEYRTAFPHESIPSPYVHTINDTVTNLSLEHVLQFSKLALAFAIELGEPSTAR